MTRVLVTGGSGFIGQHLVAALVDQGPQVRILDLRPPRRAAPGVQYLQGSVLDPERTEEALDGVDEVYHLAGLPGMWTPDKDDFIASNDRGTERMLAAAHKLGVARFLHCSTESIFFGRTPSEPVVTENTWTTSEDMPGVYTRSKHAAERHALQAAASGMPVVIVNPTMPIGPHDYELTPPTAMLRYFLCRRIQFYPDIALNLVDVRDVAAGLILAMERGQLGQRYILGGENVSLKKLLHLIAKTSGHRHLAIPIPAVLAQIMGTTMEFFADHLTHRAPSATGEAVQIALRSNPLSIEMSQRELGYAPRPLEAAMRDTISWLLSVEI